MRGVGSCEIGEAWEAQPGSCDVDEAERATNRRLPPMKCWRPRGQPAAFEKRDLLGVLMLSDFDATRPAAASLRARRA